MNSKQFKNEVSKMLTLLGYEVLPHDGSHADFFATKRVSTGVNHRIFVGCKYSDKEATSKLITDFISLVHTERNKHAVDSGLFVINADFADSSYKCLFDEPSPVELTLFSELKARILNPAKYLNNSIKEWTVKHGKFIDSSGVKVDSDEKIDSVQGFLNEFTESRLGGILYLTGGYGVGKTTHLMEFCRKKANSYLSSNNAPFPLFIPLDRYRGYRGDKHFDEFIVQYLITMYPGVDYNWSGVAYQLTTGSAFVVLDGLDEMTQSRDSKLLSKELLHILKTLPASTKIIISSRESLSVNFGKIMNNAYAATQSSIPEFIAVRVTEFNESDVNEYLLSRNIRSRDEIAVFNSPIVRSLLKRPLFLSLMGWVANEDRSILTGNTTAEVLANTIDYLLGYKDEHRFSNLSIEEWKDILGKIALRLTIEGKKGIDIDSLQLLIGSEINKNIDVQDALSLYVDARVRTVFDLVNDELRFSHAVLRDFLAAKKIADLLESGRSHDIELNDLPLSNLFVEFIQYFFKNQKKINNSLPESGYPKFKLEHGWAWIPPGLSICTDTSTFSSSRRKYRIVRFNRGYWVSATPLTISDLVSIKAHCEVNESLTSVQNINDRNARYPKRMPLVRISYDEARSIAAAIEGRLPTVNEWERACKGPSLADIDCKQISYSDPYFNSPPRVKTSQSNIWGLYDCSGCVWQWTSTQSTSGTNYCVGPWWGEFDRNSKRKADEYLEPSHKSHVRTGMRILLCEE